MKEIELTHDQTLALRTLRRVYGHGGYRYTKGNNRLIGKLLVDGMDNRIVEVEGRKIVLHDSGEGAARERSVTNECLEAVAKIIGPV